MDVLVLRRRALISESPSLRERIALCVGDELRLLRIDAGLSARKLGKLCGSFGPVVSRIEGGHHVPTLWVAVLTAEMCGGSATNIGAAIDRALKGETTAGAGDVSLPTNERPLRRVARRVAARATPRMLVTQVPAEAGLESETLH